jgi:hypothetical protein
MGKNEKQPIAAPAGTFVIASVVFTEHTLTSKENECYRQFLRHLERAKSSLEKLQNLQNGLTSRYEFTVTEVPFNDGSESERDILSTELMLEFLAKRLGAH